MHIVSLHFPYFGTISCLRSWESPKTVTIQVIYCALLNLLTQIEILVQNHFNYQIRNNMRLHSSFEGQPLWLNKFGSQFGSDWQWTKPYWGIIELNKLLCHFLVEQIIADFHCFVYLNYSLKFFWSSCFE